jgi:hypothetical protein
LTQGLLERADDVAGDSDSRDGQDDHFFLLIEAQALEGLDGGLDCVHEKSAES